MTENDVVELTEVEIALIATVKIVIAKKNFNAILGEMLANAAYHTKVKNAIVGCQDIPGEIKSMTLGKWMDIARAAITEISAP